MHIKKTRLPEGRRESKSISRVLYWMIIYLGATVTGRLKRSTLHSMRDEQPHQRSI